MKLQELMDSMKFELTSFNVYERKLSGNNMFSHFTWLTTEPADSYDQHVKALLLRLPVTVYVHEREDGTTFDVLSGGEYVEGLRYHSRSNEIALRRRIMELEIRFVIFHCTMSREDVNTVMNWIKP